MRTFLYLKWTIYMLYSVGTILGRLFSQLLDINSDLFSERTCLTSLFLPLISYSN